MSETLLALLIPAIVGLISGIIGARVAYKRVTVEEKGVEAEAERDEAEAAEIIKNASIDLIKPLMDKIKAQEKKTLSMTERLDRLKGRVEHLETVVAVQGELLFILRSGAEKLIGQLEDARVQPLFTLDHDKVVELEKALSEACDERRVGSGGDV